MSRKIITTEIVKCDICGVESDCKTISYPVLFVTEQTEGKPCVPYISQEKIDVCPDCMCKIIKVTAYGAQGHKTFRIIKED